MMVFETKEYIAKKFRQLLEANQRSVPGELLKAAIGFLDPPVQPPENMPKGYKWKGEYRRVKYKEWYAFNQRAHLHGDQDETHYEYYIIYKIEPVQPPVKVPEGYELRYKEKRLPKKDEWAINHSGGAFQAGCDYLMEQYYIIYKIAPKFKSGEIVMLESQIRFVTKDGLRLPDGDLSSAIQDECRPTTNMEIGVYCKEFPESTVAAFRTLAKKYAEEAK